jgi:hypothetical protein
LKFFVRAKVLCMLLDLCKGLKFVVFSFAVFHGVHSYYTILWIFAEEQYGLGGGVDEAAGAGVRHLGQGEPGPLPGRGRNLHITSPTSSSFPPHTLYKIIE